MIQDITGVSGDNPTQYADLVAIIFAATVLVLFLLLCLGIYLYVSEVYTV